MKIALRIAYLGTAYAGFQVQENALTVQAVLQEAAERLYGGCPVTGCSRTDAGVHARDYCCTLQPEQDKVGRIPVTSLPEAMNRFLPDDIAVKSAVFVPDSFHPRYAVLYKEYEYLIYNAKRRSPFYTGRALPVPYPIDSELMDRAAQAFVGTHDFRACMAAGSKVEDTVRTVRSSHVLREGELVRFIVSSDGFLYHMVRIMAGTLLEVSRGKIPEKELPQRLASCQREQMGATAPACGLYLNRVVYPDEAFRTEG